jgi:hypothetical protein
LYAQIISRMPVLLCTAVPRIGQRIVSTARDADSLFRLHVEPSHPPPGSQARLRCPMNPLCRHNYERAGKNTVTTRVLVYTLTPLERLTEDRHAVHAAGDAADRIKPKGGLGRHPPVLATGNAADRSRPEGRFGDHPPAYAPCQCRGAVGDGRGPRIMRPRPAPRPITIGTAGDPLLHRM